MPDLPPPDSGHGCAAWVYVLHWDRPSRLAALKNALGDSVSIISEYYPPGTKGQPLGSGKPVDQTTSPWTVERVADARFAKPPVLDDKGNLVASPHDGAAVGGAADGSDWGAPTNANWSAKGVTVTYKQGTDLEAYLPSLPPLQPTPIPAAPFPTPTPATGVDVTADSTITDTYYPWGGNVSGTYHLLAYDQFGNQATWTWTLTFGKDSGGNQIYGDDPGSPFVAYDQTAYLGGAGPAPQPYIPNYPDNARYPQPAPGALPVGSSIPGVTGTPLLGLVRVEGPKRIVSDTADKVNWGLFTFQDRTPYSSTPGDYCKDPGETAKNYELKQQVYPDDSGKIAQIEEALQLVYFGGMYTAGGTPSKEGLRRAGVSLENDTFLTDPLIRIRCDRPYGLIFCTDGLSNVCNPAGGANLYGPPALPATVDPVAFDSGGEPWTSPCEGYYGTDAGCYTAAVPPGGGAARLWRCCDPGSKQLGSGFDCETNTMLDASIPGNDVLINTYKTAPGVPAKSGTPDGFVAGIAESLFTNGFIWTDPNDGSKTKTRVRTFVIGLSPTVGKCELNYTAYRGRTDASAAKGDAGYTYQIIPAPDPNDPVVDPGDPRLPQDQNGENGTTPNTYAASIGSGDYAFFANDSSSIYDAFQEIIAGTATGDYATSPPIAGASIKQGNIVLLPSTEYPKWKGRLRAVDTQKPTGSNTKWDAGEILSNPKDKDHMWPADRKIYTWDPANLGSGLIEVVTGNQGTLAPISGVAAKFTTAVIDFIRGNDGSLTNKARSWVFGASINSTPAVVGQPEIYTGNFQSTHAAYEILHKNRKPIAWVGADDGMLHAFNFDTGKEILALVPPELLARQVKLHDNYLTLVNPITKERKAPTGQNPDIRQHIWGVAQSFRYADVYDTKNSVWKTIGYLTLGPAGSSVTAIDVTHPSSTDEGYIDATKPVEILWVRPTASDPLPGLGQSWSVPAVAANQKSPENYLMLMGAGFNAASIASDQKDSRLFQLQALDGKDGSSTGNSVDIPVDAVDAGNKPLIGQQAFSASVFFDSTMPTFYGNNIADLGLQADLNGRIWFNYPTGGTIDFDQVKIGIDVPKEVGNIEGAADQAPLYYPPAASGVAKSGCQVYSFGSGTSYEKSPLVINPNGSSAPSGEQSNYSWKPRLFIAVNANKAATQFGSVTVTGPDQAIYAVQVSSIELPPCDLTKPGPRCRVGTSDPTTFGLRTQMTAPPFLLVPITPTFKSPTKAEEQSDFQALFLLYDPDAIGYCRGFSYVVVLSFTLNSGCETVTVDKTEVYEGGEGAASGFAMAGTKIVVGKSGVGSGQKAGVFETPINILSYGGFGNVTPVYWKELQ
jgi:hypothetical protein